MSKQQVIDGLVARGYQLEGLNAPKTVTQKVTGALKERASNVVEAVKDVGQAQGVTETLAQAGRVPLRALGQAAGAVGDVIGETVVNPALQATGLAEPLAEGVQALANTKTAQAIVIPEPLKEPLGDILNVAGLVTGGTGAKVAGETVGKGVVKGAKGVKNTATNVSESVRNLDILPLDAPDNIKTSLNPFLTKTDADISVPTASGYILKKVKDVTPQERVSVQNETSSLYQNLLENAKKFKEDRRDTFSPLEVVGQRTDKALNDVDAFRRQEGKRMGEIEKSLNDQTIDIRGSRIDTFVNEYLGSSKSFGRKTKDTAFVDDFANDYDKLVQNPTVANVLEFTRTWSNELEDLKDGFGAFKDNKRTYTVIEGAISDLKNGARNVISETNPEYKKALANYRLTSQIREEGNRLLGKEGLAGERLKGGAAAKRAVQSSSDAGARQFFNVLKKVTGYDGLKEADIALQAMKDVGDYQGLSLLEVNRDLYQATVGKALSKIPFAEAGVELSKAITSKVVPQEKRVRNLIEKTDVKPSKKVAPTKTSFKDLPNQQGGFISTGATTDLIKEAKKYKSAEEFVKAQETKSPDYAVGGGSGHTAPLRNGEDAPAFDLTQLYPDNIYSEKASRLYSSGFPEADRKAISILQDIKGNPDAEITIYRAVPKGKGIKDFNKGDWVTLTKEYVKEHGESNLDGKYEILSKKVKADELFTDANSIQEFGYDPRGLDKSQLEQIWKEAQKIGGSTKINPLNAIAGGTAVVAGANAIRNKKSK